MSERSVFESVRDTYFINPKNPDSAPVIEAATTLLDKMIREQPTHEIPSLREPSTLFDVSHTLVDELRWARRFNHHSVAQIHPADNLIGILSHLASTIKNNNTVTPEVSDVETRYEKEAIAWLLENIAGYDLDRASGSLVSGGTMANMTALFVAREVLSKVGWNGTDEAVLFTSDMSHYSIDKATGILAPRVYNKMDPKEKPKSSIRVDMVPLEAKGYRMDLAELQKRVIAARKRKQPILGIVAVAGETHTGLVDDLDSIAEIANKYDVRLHIDGAYGAPYILSRAGNLFASMKKSDSLTCDPHKYLYVPYSSGAVLFADSSEHAIIHGLNERGKDYIYDSDRAKVRQEFEGVELGMKRIEGSAGGQSAAALYNTIRYIGKEGLAGLLDHTLDMAQLFAERIRVSDAGLSLSFEPQLNTVCVQPTSGTIKYNDRKIELVTNELEKEHGIYITTTSLPSVRGKRPKKKTFRFVATHPHTDEKDVVFIADKLIKTWKKRNNQ